MKIRKALETTIKRIKTEKAGEWIWKDGGGELKVQGSGDWEKEGSKIYHEILIYYRSRWRPFVKHKFGFRDYLDLTKDVTVAWINMGMRLKYCWHSDSSILTDKHLQTHSYNHTEILH